MLHANRDIGRPARTVLCALALLAATLASEIAQAGVGRDVTSRAGIQARLVEDHSVPLVALRFAFPVGGAREPDGQQGITRLLARMLVQGAGDLDASAFKHESQRLGLRMSFEAGRDVLIGAVDMLSRNRAQATNLVAAALQRPRFAAEDFERVRAALLAEVAEAAHDPLAVASAHWYATAFPGSPYGRAVDGTAATIAALTPADLARWHAEVTRRGGLSVVAVGDIDAAGLADLVDALLSSLPDAAPHATERVRMRTDGARDVVALDAPGTTILFGLPAPAPDDPDFAALLVMNHILGSGDLDSALIGDLRVRQGLVYAARSLIVHDRYATLLSGELATGNDKAGAALASLSALLRQFADEGPTEDEVANARAALAGAFLLGFDSSGRLADGLLNARLDGRGLDFIAERKAAIEAVTRADILRVARATLRLDRLVVTVAGGARF